MVIYNPALAVWMAIESEALSSRLSVEPIRDNERKVFCTTLSQPLGC